MRNGEDAHSCSFATSLVINAALGLYFNCTINLEQTRKKPVVLEKREYASGRGGDLPVQ